ncbi:immunoglobulin-like domain-containing protein [Candidatus Enterococcus mansonii]|uniref:Pesticidal crystal protein Cry22Aa Ig-like domain-containing protein n=1 Tax=Candidatus Enterococcus mansonii TaxID=1834181 RepID=A0A242C6M0_9ENTE|nr:immunoglobulin-like domain-containing protein [Enterococcus sp. 4G2_DIV0659]OTO05895.1 hypothetical protein A5880_003070 [Enterococcus sp. 4G2_DIV0659]
MKTHTIKQTIIIGFISILGIALFISGYIGTDLISRTKTDTEPKKEKVTLLKNVPTEKALDKKVITKKTQPKAKIVAVNVVKDTTAPTINAPEETIEQNTPVDVYAGVTATDTKDGDLTNKLVASQTLDTSIPGDYTVRFTATDNSGNTGAADRIIHVIAAKNQEAPQAEPVAAPQPEPTTVAATAPESAPAVTAAPAYAPMTMTMSGQTIPYQNGGQGSGQSIIDSNPGGVASTWGGAAVQSGDDNQNTHFIGHNPGAFSIVFSLGVGSQIVVTDANGTPTTYTVRTLLQLDDYGTEVGTGTNYWDLTVGTGGGERITLQSCINDNINLFVIAYK